jgi:DNA (cytosine-5)-methyltransferase 1
MSTPIIDLFAGPGGLGEGFSAVRDASGQSAFRIGLSIEKESSAFRTLKLRATYRHLHKVGRSAPYFDFIRGTLSYSEFEAAPGVIEAIRAAEAEVRQYELGQVDELKLDQEIRTALAGREDWVLIGGPPCQAYSLVGRARRTNDLNFAADEKHFLYKEYLRIIREHRPAIFVMENVKGLLSSKHSGEQMFERIREDLSRPLPDLEYEICSFVVGGRSSELKPYDYVIEAESYGIPQTRHRVILLGIRKGYAKVPVQPLIKTIGRVTVFDAISNLPPLRSRLSRGNDSFEGWLSSVEKATNGLKGWRNPIRRDVEEIMTKAAAEAGRWSRTGGTFIPWDLAKTPTEYFRWIHSNKLGGVTLHEARAHMSTDLARYLFVSAYAAHTGESPRLRDFPPRLLPEHRSALEQMESGVTAFQDRFRVQCKYGPSSTVVSHIAKDGHYYIHYDSAQCRSLTVREAARLQTFPDDYYFLGNRTQQYTQVGNAVPPLLALKLGVGVLGLISKAKNRQISHRATL